MGDAGGALTGRATKTDINPEPATTTFPKPATQAARRDLAAEGRRALVANP